MKVWIKLLLGTLAGILAAQFLPMDNETINAALIWLEELALRIGRYTVVPLLVFSLSTAVHELRQEGRFWSMVLRSFICIALSGVLVIAAGLVFIQFFSPGRVPIHVEEELGTVSLDTAGNILALFPSNMFQSLVGDGVYLFPVCIFAFFLGMGLSYDRNFTKPVITFIDSLSRIFYHITVFFSEILGLIMIILAAYWALRFKGVLREKVYNDLIMLLGGLSLGLCFVVLPLFLYFLRPKVNPWVVLYGNLGPALASWFSGDINFTLPVLLRHGKENSGIRRRSNTLVLALFNTFGRAGSAMTAAVAFILIIKSYSRLDITLADSLSIGLRAFLISFFLAGRPGDGAYTALALLCLGYGRGFVEAGYLFLKPLAFYLVTVGTFLDAMIASFCSFAIARLSGYQEDKSPRHFI
ncbi:MAG: cation:dicarboxylase symporter family transporter [Treponema sp.]|jgi:Na+/H+-dicarboxylate symporter|nr:cation:dicarboxylase symporter family transporter [Treponema sp.]